MVVVVIGGDRERSECYSKHPVSGKEIWDPGLAPLEDRGYCLGVFLPLQRDLDTGRVNRAAFDGHVAELLGQPAPGREARYLTSLALREWRSTGDPAWLAAIGSIDARLVQCEDLAARMGGRDGLFAWRSLRRYWVWRGRRLAWCVRDESALCVIRAVAAARAARIDAKKPVEEPRPPVPRLSLAQRRAQATAQAIEKFRRGAARMAQNLAEQGKGP